MKLNSVRKRKVITINNSEKPPVAVPLSTTGGLLYVVIILELTISTLKETKYLIQKLKFAHVYNALSGKSEGGNNR